MLAIELSKGGVEGLQIEHVDTSALLMLNTYLEKEGRFPVEVEAFRQKILEDDCFLLASPEHNYSVSGDNLKMPVALALKVTTKEYSGWCKPWMNPMIVKFVGTGIPLHVMVGTMIKIDHSTSIHNKGGFVQICMGIHLCQPLPPTFYAFREGWSIACEGSQMVCFSYGKYGHETMDCLLKMQGDRLGKGGNEDPVLVESIEKGDVHESGEEAMNGKSQSMAVGEMIKDNRYGNLKLPRPDFWEFKVIIDILAKNVGDVKNEDDTRRESCQLDMGKNKARLGLKILDNNVRINNKYTPHKVAELVLVDTKPKNEVKAKAKGKKTV